MSTVKDSLQSDLAAATRRVTELFRVQDRLAASTMPVDLRERDGFYVSGYDYRKGTLHIHTDDFGRDARALLPVVGKWEKEVDQFGDFRMKGTLLGEFEIILYGDLPSGCKLEVEETSELVPEHLETRRKYKVSGCDPILAEPEQVNGGVGGQVDDDLKREFEEHARETSSYVPGRDANVPE